MKSIRTFFILLVLVLLTSNVSAQEWDILNRDFSTTAWNAYPRWELEKSTSIPASFVTQKTGYININKTQAYGRGYYGFLISPVVSTVANTPYTYEIKARLQAINKSEYPDIPKPPGSNAGGYESNHIAFRLNNKYMSIHLTHGDENTGTIAPHVIDGTGISPSRTIKRTLNTSEWHVYRLVFDADNTKYSVYVDGELFFKDVLVINRNGTNLSKIGGESWQRCNVDIEYFRMATGDLVSGNKPQIVSVQLSSDSHIANNARTIQVRAHTSFVNNGERLLMSLVDENGTSITNPIEVAVSSNTAAVYLTIPAAVPIGKYAVKASVSNDEIAGQAVEPKSKQYVVVDVSPIETKMLPQVKTVGYVKEISDYKYLGPSGEFIFPSIIDTKKHTINGKFKNGQTPIDRYYLYYAPHENPGGIFLSTAPTLDGPWTEYAGSPGMTPGTVMDFDWAAAQNDIIKYGAEKHISACQVVWNEVQDKYIMYFHGPNTTTHYASSVNLVDWTFGADILDATYFSPSGEEASYAKAFEHEIPGLGNKYVLFLMNQEAQIRRIYWAHSKDGINWTAVTKPLISPDLDYKKVPGTDRKPNYSGGGTGAYGNNISGPFLMERAGRYFIICHDTADNLIVVEIGESFDMEVHWGEYMSASDVMLNVNGRLTPTRPAAPDFIQDDSGKWYMFFEAGGRLDANIGYAKEPDVSAMQEVSCTDSVIISKTALNVGQTFSIEAVEKDTTLSEVALYNLIGNKVYSNSVSDYKYAIQAPDASGMYILSVSLSNDMSKEFKILVK